MTAPPVEVVVVFGTIAATPASWHTPAHLLQEGVRVAAFFPRRIPPRKPKGVRAYLMTATPRPGRRRLRAWVARAGVERQLAQVRRQDDPDPVWAQAAGDLRLLAAVRTADVIVAADRTAVPAVWHLMRANRSADVVLGYGEAARRVEARLRRDGARP